jgi:ketosteroid isomerase-like protein
MADNSAVRACLWIGALLTLAGARDLFAQSVASRTKDETAIRQAGKDYLATIEKGDVKAAADFWTADGTYTDESGRTVKVRELLAKSSDQPGGPASRAVDPNAKVRFVADGAVLEEGDFELQAGDGATATKGHYAALWVRDNGRWKLDHVNETRIEATASTPPLASLNVFAGEWSGESNKISIRVSAKWDANTKFLHREITMTGGKAALVGRQEIGWDPLSQQIRSWMFSDDGSYSEGLWSMEGNLWMVLATRVLPDGRISKATQVYRFPDKNTVVWKSIRGTVDGQPTDDFEVVLKRSVTK